MREELLTLARTYPVNPIWRDKNFAANPIRSYVAQSLPAALRAALPALDDRYLVEGSAGDGSWTHTPWIAILDPKETSTVQEGIYLVYTLSKGGEWLYLTLNQGCTRLKVGPGGIPGARAELRRRAEAIWQRLEGRARRLKRITINLNVEARIWRGKLYECGAICGVAYRIKRLPTQDVLVADMSEALDLYAKALNEGGWAADDTIQQEAADEGFDGPLDQAKRYRMHRQIERQAAHARRVKRLLGHRCMGCDKDMLEVYGPLGEAMVDAHHLTPLASLVDGSWVTFRPKKDFAVLCPNCHRAIHRSHDPSDVNALREMIAAARRVS